MSYSWLYQSINLSIYLSIYICCIMSHTTIISPFYNHIIEQCPHPPPSSGPSRKSFAKPWCSARCGYCVRAKKVYGWGKRWNDGPIAWNRLNRLNRWMGKFTNIGMIHGSWIINGPSCTLWQSNMAMKQAPFSWMIFPLQCQFMRFPTTIFDCRSVFWALTFGRFFTYLTFRFWNWRGILYPPIAYCDKPWKTMVSYKQIL